MVYGGDVVDLRVNGNLRIVELGDGTTLVAHAVVVASGVSYRTLDVASLDALQGVGVYYGSAMSEHARSPANTRTSSAVATRPDKPRCTSRNTQSP